MKPGWRTATLDEVSVVGAGNSAPQDKRLFEGGTYPFFRTSDVGRVKVGELAHAQDHLNQAGIKKLKLHRAGTILIPKSGASTFLDHRVMMAIDGYVSSHLATLFPKPSVVDGRYLFWASQQIVASEIATDASYPTLSLEQIKGIEIPLPPLEEQRRIVAVLDEAFAAIATATANAEKNLANARELFEGYLAGVFATDQPNPNYGTTSVKSSATLIEASNSRNREQTSTGGREATERPIQGRRALGVGLQRSLPPNGWAWHPLTTLARLESGHTPSRARSSYWGGDIPWIGIKDAKANHGGRISFTLENVTQTGIANSSARILPKGTVCISRTASVGYVVVMDREMATSQDFLNWVCSDRVLPEFLQYIFIAQGDDIFRFSSGAVHQTIYYPEAKAFWVCIPDLTTQLRIVAQANAFREASEQLKNVYVTKRQQLVALKQTLLQRAFAGELTATASDLIPV